MENENGFCPNCNADFDGENILQVLLRQGNSPQYSLYVAQNFYRYTNTRTKFSRKISLYSFEKDKEIGYSCPDCNHTWDE
jgi:hypothetical protein